MRKIALVLFVLVMLLGGQTSYPPPIHAQDPCSGLIPNRLAVGDTARVIFDGDGLGSALWNAPGKEQSGSQQVGNISEGTVVTVVAGPVCLDGMVWLKVALPNESEFWVGEGDSQRYYLEPFVVSTELMVANQERPRVIQRWEVTYSGEVIPLPDLSIPDPESFTARDKWQPDDINAANDALNVRRQQCPDVLVGTPWEGVSNAADMVIPEGAFDLYPAPAGGRALIVRHWVVQMPTCGGALGRYYGVSTVHFIRPDRPIVDLFPYPQHGGVRSRQACLSPDVNDQAWTTFFNQVEWSPDADTVALNVRYLDTDPANPARECAYYFNFLIDVFNVQVTPLAEGRRVFWGGGGTRLFYLTFEVDDAYNVLSEQLWQLSDGQTTQINVNAAEGVQFVPSVFNSTGMVLPSNQDGNEIMVCNYATGCPELLAFNISRRTFSDPITIPAELAPRDILQMHYAANDMRLLWVSTAGKVYVQSLDGPDRDYWAEVNTGLPAGTRIVELTLLPTGISAILHDDRDGYWLLNTYTREVQPLQLS